MNRGKDRWAKRALVVVAMLFLLAPSMGCDEEGAVDEFRRVSAEGLSSGLQSMFAAIMDGLFAIYVPEESSSSSSAASSGNPAP
jgi:hypothetical protein